MSKEDYWRDIERSRAWARENYQKHREQRVAYQREYYQQNRTARLEYAAKRRQTIVPPSRVALGMTANDIEALRAKQNHACAICQKYLKPGSGEHLDHCHVTRRIRGLLCDLCNKGLGQFKDDLNLLRAAVEYLEAHS